MKDIRYLLTFVFIVLVATACKKEREVKISSKNASLIIGNWLSTQRHTLVYSIDNNTLLKDTTINYDAANNINWWFEIYNADGNAFVTGKPYKQNNILKADTTSFLKYTINGSSIILKPNGGGSETKTIRSLTETNMALEGIYNAFPRLGWGLDIRTEYHFVEQAYYTKQ
ncbi:hypothetical protein ACFQZS_04565 [Mucilaginibacter calamicampi]|uniref:Lipocalin-like domain-containing protein n=1 Tax=Mucilaginibacter calamicampi TaxID=1302352 RepID=A0ABW2YSU4_9SPHI